MIWNFVFYLKKMCVGVACRGTPATGARAGSAGGAGRETVGASQTLANRNASRAARAELRRGGAKSGDDGGGGGGRARAAAVPVVVTVLR